MTRIRAGRWNGLTMGWEAGGGVPRQRGGWRAGRKEESMKEKGGVAGRGRVAAPLLGGAGGGLTEKLRVIQGSSHWRIREWGMKLNASADMEEPTPGPSEEGSRDAPLSRNAPPAAMRPCCFFDYSLRLCPKSPHCTGTSPFLRSAVSVILRFVPPRVCSGGRWGVLCRRPLRGWGKTSQSWCGPPRRSGECAGRRLRAAFLRGK